MVTAAIATTEPALARTWSDEQEKILDWFATGTGNKVVRARAGTGKTSVIIEGVRRMPEAKVLLAAFNKSIANELTARVGGDPRIEAKTLHGLGFAYVRRNWKVRIDEEGLRARQLAQAGMLTVVDRPCPENAIRLVRDLHSKARDVNPRIAIDDDGLRGMARIAARFDLMPDDDIERAGWNVRDVCAAALAAMRLAMERTDVIDFADMIFLPIVHRWIRPWYDAVVVDETQDMTPAQLEIAVGACKGNGRVCIVGDDRQAIYQWRGAELDGVDRLKDALNADELGMTITWRCPRLVVELAARIVPDYRSAPGAPDGEVATCDDEKMVEQVREGDFVLSRTNAPLVRTCLAILKRGVRATIKGRDVGKGIAALIRKLEVVAIDDIRPAIDAWVERERKKAAKMPTDAREARMEVVYDQREIVIALADGCDDLDAMQRRCDNLFADRADRASVMLSTVHRAKGLEADTVYLMRDTFRGIGETEGEEANVVYVAITRARRRLVWVASRLHDGGARTKLDPGIGLDVAVKHHGDEAVVDVLPSTLTGTVPRG